MAGTRHHFIPRFLLRGFRSHDSGDEVFAWVVRRDRPPFKTNIKNIAVEGHFYSLDDKPYVDDMITVAEGDFAELVADLRVSSEASVAAVPAARLIAHLEGRTRHLRQNLELIGGATLKRTLRFIGDHDVFKHFVIKQFERDPELLIGLLREEIKKLGIPAAQAASLLSAFGPRLPAFVEATLPSLAARFSALVQRALVERPDLLRNAARNGQLRALEQSIAPSLKVAEYEKLSYSVLGSPRELPLGDSAVFFEIAGARRFTTFTSADDKLLAAYLPLTPETVLVGCVADHNANLELLPEAIAMCAQDYFVAASDSPHIRALQALIAELAVIMDADTIEQLLAEVFIP